MAKFVYSEEEDHLKEESIDNYKELFFPYKLKFPTLSEALEQMYTNSGISSNKIEAYIKDIVDKCKKTCDEKERKNAIDKEYPNLTDEERYIISSYTCESSYGYENSPYIILNRNGSR